MQCPFCQRVAANDVIASNDLAVGFFDGFPISNGHALVVPKRHEADFFALSSAEQHAIYDLIAVVRTIIERQHSPAGYTIGVNIGAAAGQTTGHAHLHVIPRYVGDVADPRGGVR
jgi:ATP adenylyltransferase